MQLQDTTKHLNRSGQEDFEMSAGQSLKVETTPGGSEILNTEVPAEKQWHVWVTVTIEEIDL